jgi:hypothetical protein
MPANMSSAWSLRTCIAVNTWSRAGRRGVRLLRGWNTGGRFRARRWRPVRRLLIVMPYTAGTFAAAHADSTTCDMAVYVLLPPHLRPALFYICACILCITCTALVFPPTPWNYPPPNLLLATAPTLACHSENAFPDFLVRTGSVPRRDILNLSGSMFDNAAV